MDLNVGKNAQPAAPAAMGGFERYLTVWVFLCIVVGIVLGQFFAPVFQAIGQMEVAKVNLPVGLLIWVMVIPILVLMFRRGRKPLTMFIIAVMVIVGAWFKRFLIVIPTLSHPFIPMTRVPESWQHYIPTFKEWVITGSTLAGALLIITFLSRLFPIIPIAETIEHEEAARKGKPILD